SRQGNRNELNISVGTTATTGREYYLRIPISYQGFTHYLWYYVAVRTELNNSQSINQYLYALGYAKFRITAITSNNIRGRAISGLLQPDEITSGLQPRLQAWDTSTP
ncbi:MAG TPA: hypothetical protein VFT99_22285, partial [Roseiflexaceae bacterium]|nr:hypothetical protein [Roseiflexaceae bacterium]